MFGRMPTGDEGGPSKSGYWGGSGASSPTPSEPAGAPAAGNRPEVQNLEIHPARRLSPLRSLIAVLAVVAVVAVAGAVLLSGGNSSGPSNSASGFASQMTLLCAQIPALPAQGLNSANEVSFLERDAPVQTKLVPEFAALTPPANKAAAYRAWVAFLQFNLSKLQGAVAAARAGNTQRFAALLRQVPPVAVAADRAALSAGVGCANPTTTSPAQLSTAPLQPSTGDAAAAELARTAEVAIETLATDNNGSYAPANGDPLAMSAYGSIQIAPGNGEPYLSAITSTASSYAVTVTSTTGDTFSVIRASSGLITRTCTPPHATSGTCVNGTW
jgi:hypothetical protein